MTDDISSRHPGSPPAPRPDKPIRRPAALPEDDDFRVRTVDTGALGSPERALPVPSAAADSNSTDAAAVSDDFTAKTVEPGVKPRAAPPIQVVTPRRTPRTAAPSRRRRPHDPKPRVWLSTMAALLTASAAAILVATIFSLWTRPTFFSEEFRAGVNRVYATQHLINIQLTPLPTEVREVRVGIIAGHSGPSVDTSFASDPGAVCDDGLTELEINTAVAQRVVAALQQDGYTVDLLHEFDPRLQNYYGSALVSIHTNSCADFGYAGTGFNAASASARQSTAGADDRLLDCLVDQYQKTTGLPRHYGLTHDMTEYHTFGEVSRDTPTAIIEVGFMRLDREMLTQHPDILAQGIANGVRCFLRPDLYGSPPSAAQEPQQAE